ncbi:MAG TPA: EAL domain-containing protein, partial [Acetobacteraceae bacterium]|nr:EAL domain-containing protein [Acetobacteraceae bacterium]
AHHDPLTGLANRILFNERLAEAVAEARRQQGSLALLILDLDRFKSVNDLHGHAVGDRLMQEAAARLVHNVREGDMVARLVGDEFAIVQVTGEQPASSAGLAQRLVDVLGRSFEIDGQMISIGGSAGIALYPQDGAEPSGLFQAADLALNRAKRDGRNTFCFFEPGMDIKFREHRMLEQELRQALAREELTVDYQPLVDCGTLEARGFEALVRWRHPTRGFISPAEFIPLAEETSLILPLSRHVLATACNEAASWPHPYRIAVNLSPSQFRAPNLAEEIVETVARSGLSPERLELEITEGVLIGDTERTLKVLRRLKDHGIRIALDDFGTGYSSLSYLRRFPFDKIKIDRSFVQNLGIDEEAEAIVRAILALGRSLRLDVTAEGVENAAQLETLRVEGCNLVQGFLLGRPSAAPLSAARRLQALAGNLEAGQA